MSNFSGKILREIIILINKPLVAKSSYYGVFIYRDWESVFATWSQGPSKTEQERAENTERQIRKAIHASPPVSRLLSPFSRALSFLEFR